MMEWTTQLPTKPGWYWQWNEEYGILIIELEEIDGRIVWRPYYDLGPYVDMSSSESYWMGPIEQPEPPK